MKLFYAPGTCARACWIALEWAGLDYDVVKVDQHSEEYLRINPLGMVPALQLDDGKILTQVGAIMNYILALAPDKDLGADDGILEAYDFNEIMAFLSGDFHPAFWPVFIPARYTMTHTANALQAVQEAAYLRIDKVMSHLDAKIGETDHVYKDKKTVADAYAYIMMLWSVKTPKPYKDYPNIARFATAFEKDPVVQTVLKTSK